MNTLRREYRRESRRVLGVVLWKVALIVGVAVVLWSGVIASTMWAIAAITAMMR